eukprot:Skav200380  [mRNA]  locus=scaffold2518:393800:398071:- [translate_table: standard]
MAKRPMVEDTGLSLETLRDLLQKEVTEPLRSEISTVAKQAEEAVALSRSAAHSVKVLGVAQDSLKKQIDNHDRKLEQLDKKIEATKSTDPWAPMQSTGRTVGPSSASSSPHIPEGTVQCLFGGFPKDTRKKAIEDKVEEILKQLSLLSVVDRSFAPGVRGQICRVDVKAAGGKTARENAFKLMQAVRDMKPTFADKPVWFTIHKSPREREIASFTSRSIRTLQMLGLDAAHVEGDRRRGIVWSHDARLADYSVCKDFPLIAPTAHATGKTELEASEPLTRPMQSSCVHVLGGDFNVEFAQCAGSGPYAFGDAAKTLLAVSMLSVLRMAPLAQHVSPPCPTRYPWPGQNHTPRTLDWFACNMSPTVAPFVLLDAQGALHTDHVPLHFSLDIMVYECDMAGTKQRRRFCKKRWKVPSCNHAAYQQDCAQIFHFFSDLWPLLEGDAAHLRHNLAAATFLPFVSYDDLVWHFQRALQHCFVRHAAAPQSIRFQDSPDLTGLVLSRKGLACGDPMRKELSKIIFHQRRAERVHWRLTLIREAANGGWKHFQLLQKLQHNGTYKRRHIPMTLTYKDSVYQFQEFTHVATLMLQEVSLSDDLFHDCPRLVRQRLTELTRTTCHAPVIEPDEVTRAVTRLTSGKAVGVDGLTNEVFVCVGPEVSSHLATWFTMILHGIIAWPRVWDTALVHLVPKTPAIKTFSQFRPLAVTAILYKIFMRVIARRLQIELGDHQHGQVAGLPGHQVHEIIHTIDIMAQRAREWKEPLYLLSWDFRKAFDSLEWHGVLEMLSSRGASSATQYCILRSLVQQQSDIQLFGFHAKNAFSPTRGIRQGAPESAVVFSYTVDFMLGKVRQALLHFPVTGLLFTEFPAFPSFLAWVDDLYIFSSSLHDLQNKVNLVHYHFAEIGLGASLDKLHLLCNKFARPGTVSLDGQALPTLGSETAIRILGMHFSMVKGFHAHLPVAVSKAWNAFMKHKNVLTCASTALSIRLSLFDVLVSGVVLWASPSWNPTQSMVRFLNTHQVRMVAYMLRVSRRPEQLWLDHHRVKFRLAWAAMRQHHGGDKFWGRQVLQRRHGWLGHVLRGNMYPTGALLWRSFHWWHRQQMLPVTGLRHPGRFHPWRADSDLEKLWVHLTSSHLHNALDAPPTVMILAHNRSHWLETLPLFLRIFDDARIDRASTAALADGDADLAPELLAVADLSSD